MSGDIVNTPKELLNIHKEVFMTEDIFLVNGIPFFIVLSQNIIFTLVINIEDRKYITIFKYFK